MADSKILTSFEKGGGGITLTSIYFNFSVNFLPFASVSYLLPKSGGKGGSGEGGGGNSMLVHFLM